MVIKSLKLRNYRRFERLDLELPENIIGIMGRNGAGKSTIVEAIGWALYGNRLVRNDKADVRTQGADDSATCSAEMVFVYGGEEYRIERRLKGKSAVSEAAVWRSGSSEPEAVQDRGVNEFIEKLLQLDYRSFLASVFAQQKDLDSLSSMQGEQRRQTVNRLINIDRIDQARETVRQDAKGKTREAAGKRSATKDVEQLKAQQKEYLLNKEKLAQASAEADKAAAVCEAQLNDAKKQLDASSLLRDQHQQWEAQIGRLQSRQDEQKKNRAREQQELEATATAERELAALQPQLADFAAIKSRKEALDAEREKATALQNRRKEREWVQTTLIKENKALAEAREACKNLSALETELKSLEAEEHALHERLKALREQEKSANGLMVTAKNRGAELKEKLAKIQQLGPESECPVCTRRLGDHFDTVVHDHESQLEELRAVYRRHQQEEAAARQQIHNAEERLRQVQALQKELAKKVQSAQDAYRRLEEIGGHIQNYETQTALIDAAIAELGEVHYDEAEYRQVKERFEALTELRQQASRLEERAGRRAVIESNIGAAEKTLAELAEEIAVARSAQAALGFDEASHQQLKQNVEAATRRYHAARDQVGAVQREAAVLERDLQNVAREIEELSQLRAELALLEEEILYLAALEKLLGDFRLDLAGRVRPLIAQRASELLALTTHSRYSQIDLDQDYNIFIYDGNRPFTIRRFSGGEQDLANLCLRIAVSQVVAERLGGAPINFIVLDEIFGSQDSERRTLILDALSRLATQFRQIFIITHIETVREVLPVLVDVEIVDEFVSRARLV